VKPTLQLRQSQHLALTPQLQQSIRLLQLSTLELQQEVGQLLDQNPFLELEEDTPATPYETPPERQSADRPAEADAEPAEGAAELGAEEFGTALRDDWENGTEGDDFDGIREIPSGSVAAGEGDDDGEAHDRRAAAGSLQDHLRAQLVGLRLQPEDLAAVAVLIESLDADGYLADPLEEVAERLAEMLGLDDPGAREQLVDRLRIVLCMLQSLDPPGVGARSLPECLKLQLKALPHGAARQVALRIAEQYLEPLARRDYRRLAALTGSHEDH
jgi:RNA polymerase sigma-54 factor